MSKKLDVNHLIAEVKQRPALWDVRLPEYKDRAASALLWREIADAMGCEVEQCKRKWKNIRDAYRAEVRRTERRVQRLKLEGHDDPKVSDSKWAFFKPMSFMSESKRKRYTTPPAERPNEVSSDSHEAYMAEATSADSHLDMDDYCQVKMEHHTTDEEGELKPALHESKSSNAAAAAASATRAVIVTPDDDDEANDKLFEQFQSVATPQAARRLSGTLTLSGSLGSNSPPSTTTTAEASTSTAVATIVRSNGNTAAAAAAAPTTAAASNNANCKCSQREDQVHFLEDLEREEQQLMQSTRRDITRASSMSFFGDSDYNFLVSFLPQMKRLSELQNLQFRAKMSELMLHIMAQPTSSVAATASALPAFGCLSAPAPSILHHPRHHAAHHVHFSQTSPLHHQTTTIVAPQQQQPPPPPQQAQQQQPHVTAEATTTWNQQTPPPKQQSF